MITKRVVRKAVRARQEWVTDLIKQKQSDLINKHLKILLRSLSIKSIATFLPFNKEPSIDIDFLLKHYEVYAPKYCEDGYSFVRLFSLANVVKGPFGILEPKETILCDSEIITSDRTGFLVPGLAFDYKGNRVGHGKGFYDRLLEPTLGVRIAVCFQDQLFASLPTDAYDQKMMYVVHDGDYFPCVGDDGY